MKKDNLMYDENSKYYDLIYIKKKNYENESLEIIKIIDKEKISKGDKLLELGCGSGNHLIYLTEKYKCLGTDLNQGILEIAKNKVKKAKFEKVNMIDFDLNQKFDIIISLFSAIGYVKTKKNLKKTIQNISSHLNFGGIVIIEGWFEKDKFRGNRLIMDTYEDQNLKICRICNTKKNGKVSELNFNWLIGEIGEDIKYFEENHELGLFDNKYILTLFQENDIKIKVLKNHKNFRNLFIGIKQ
jgi:SAM-dependent methyltransferase